MPGITVTTIGQNHVEIVRDDGLGFFRCLYALKSDIKIVSISQDDSYVEIYLSQVDKPIVFTTGNLVDFNGASVFTDNLAIYTLFKALI